jgi:hypothetical protein
MTDCLGMINRGTCVWGRLHGDRGTLSLPGIFIAQEWRLERLARATRITGYDSPSSSLFQTNSVLVDTCPQKLIALRQPLQDRYWRKDPLQVLPAEIVRMILSSLDTLDLVYVVTEHAVAHADLVQSVSKVIDAVEPLSDRP